MLSRCTTIINLVITPRVLQPLANPNKILLYESKGTQVAIMKYKNVKEWVRKMQTLHKDLSLGIGRQMPPIVHVGTPVRICSRSPSFLPDQGLKVAMKAPAKLDDHVVTKARITSIFSSRDFNVVSTIELLHEGRGLLLHSRLLTPLHIKPGVRRLASEPPKAPRGQHTLLKMMVLELLGV